MKIRLLLWFSVVIVLFASSVQAEGEQFPFSGMINAKSVNIRAGQSHNFEVVGRFQKEDPVVVVQKSYSWYKIKLPVQAKCYVHRKLVRFLRDQVGEIDANLVNIRARPELGSAVLGQLHKMTKVKVVETLNEWYRIEPLEGVFGWVREDFIDFKSAKVPPPAVVQLATRNIYAQKRKEEARLKEEQAKRLAQEEAKKLRLKGTIVVIDVPTSDRTVRHKITSDQGKTYYLMGYRGMLDGFLNHRVQIEGLPVDGAAFKQPVLMITKISLIL